MAFVASSGGECAVRAGEQLGRHSVGRVPPTLWSATESTETSARWWWHRVAGIAAKSTTLQRWQSALLRTSTSNDVRARRP